MHDAEMILIEKSVRVVELRIMQLARVSSRTRKKSVCVRLYRGAVRLREGGLARLQDRWGQMSIIQRILEQELGLSMRSQDGANNRSRQCRGQGKQRNVSESKGDGISREMRGDGWRGDCALVQWFIVFGRRAI